MYGGQEVALAHEVLVHMAVAARSGTGSPCESMLPSSCCSVRAHSGDPHSSVGLCTNGPVHGSSGHPTMGHV